MHMLKPEITLQRVFLIFSDVFVGSRGSLTQDATLRLGEQNIFGKGAPALLNEILRVSEIMGSPSVLCNRQRPLHSSEH